MKKLNSLKDIALLIEIFMNHALNGLLNRPFLAKKRTRFIFLLSILLIYFLYFYYNMKELARITPDASRISQSLIESSQKITFFSYFSNTFVLGVMLSVLINNTVALDKTSLFFVKTLPFRKNDVRLSYTFFKFIIMFLLYELVVVIATPAIQLITTNSVAYIWFFIVQQLFFLAVILFIEMINLGIHFFLAQQAKVIHWAEMIYTSLLVIGSTLYFFHFRYGLEVSLSETDFSIAQLIFLSVIASLVLCILLAFGLLKIPISDRIAYATTFVKVPSLEKVVFRYKANWYLMSCMFLIMSTILFQSGVKAAFAMMPSIFVFSGILTLNYADATSDFRQQYALLRISPLEEWLRQIFLVLFLNLPSLLFFLVGMSDVKSLILAYCIAIIALILGYLFPKSKGSLNETTAMLLLLIIFVMISLLMKNSPFGWLILLLLLMIHYFIIRSVRNEKF